jgi:hypothetical protein
MSWHEDCLFALLMGSSGAGYALGRPSYGPIRGRSKQGDRIGLRKSAPGLTDGDWFGEPLEAAIDQSFDMPGKFEIKERRRRIRCG